MENLSPDERRRLIEETDFARKNMQRILDEIEARRREREERAARHGFWARLLVSHAR
jgi:hypothetical protein